MLNKEKNKEERRSGEDRRMHAIGFEFPFIDSHGHLVTQERRQNKRRKVSGVNTTTNLEQHKNYA